MTDKEVIITARQAEALLLHFNGKAFNTCDLSDAITSIGRQLCLPPVIDIDKTDRMDDW